MYNSVNDIQTSTKHFIRATIWRNKKVTVMDTGPFENHNEAHNALTNSRKKKNTDYTIIVKEIK